MKKVVLPVLCILLVVSAVIGIDLKKIANATIPQTNRLVSYNATNTAMSAHTGVHYAHISDDGNMAVWSSGAHDVVAGDLSTGNVLYLRNLQTGAVEIVSMGVGGVISNAGEFAVSRTGRYVAFSSAAKNVVTSPDMSNAQGSHLYLRDTVANTTTLVDQNSGGSPANLLTSGSSLARSVSDDGRFVVFYSDSSSLVGSGASVRFYVKDLHTGDVIDATSSNAGVTSNASTLGPVLSSCDGSFLVFGSAATNLTPQDNGNPNTYLVDLRRGYDVTNLTHSANQGAKPISISCSGRYILMYSNSTNLTSDVVTGINSHLFLYDRLNGEYQLIDKSTSGYVGAANAYAFGSRRTVSDDGRVVFFSLERKLVFPESPFSLELYVRDTRRGVTEAVPVNSLGVEQGLGSTSSWVTPSLSISADGNFVIYTSFAAGLVPGIGASYGQKIIVTELK